MSEGSGQPTDTQHTPTFDMPPPKPKKTQKSRKPKRKTTKATSNELSSQGTSSGDGPRRQDTMGDTSALTRVISTSNDEALDKEDTSKQERTDEIDANEEFALVSTHDDVVQDGGIEDDGEEEVVKIVTPTKMLIDTVVDAAQVTTAIANVLVSAAKTIVTTAPSITAESTKTNGEVTQALKRKIVMIQEPEETTTKTASLQQPREDIQAKVDADYQLEERLQVEQQEQLADAEKAKFFMEFIKKKIFAAKRTAEKRNKPHTKAQQRSIMSTYLKNMDG
nr:hypothetical protein [Tanacetum cinerariifolium]